MVIFDSAALIVHPSPREFGEGLNPPSVFARTRDDQPSAADSLAWYMFTEQCDDLLSDPRDWDSDWSPEREQALLEDARANGFVEA